MATALTSAHGGLEEAVSMLGWHRVCLVPSVILINDVIKKRFLCCNMTFNVLVFNLSVQIHISLAIHFFIYICF